jgi:uncharacterized protein with ParB-like and HNH nuclease domain
MSIERRVDRLSSIIEAIIEQRIVVPHFQRPFVWPEVQQNNFVASCLLGKPVSGVLLLTGDATTFAHRYIANPSHPNGNNRQVLFLLNGQQRLTTLFRVYSEERNQHLTRQLSELLIHLTILPSKGKAIFGLS